MPFDDDLVLGIDLGAKQIFAALVDDGGRVHGEHAVRAPWAIHPPPPRTIESAMADALGSVPNGDPSQPLDVTPDVDADVEATADGTHGTNGEGVLDGLADVARRLLAVAESSGSRVRGIGVGVPGVTSADGLFVSAPRLGWQQLPLGGRLSDELDLPVWVDSDVNLAALGELRFGAGRGARDLVCVNVGAALGAALILDGRLYRGHRGLAGALGTILPGTSFLDWNNPSVGALEALVSGAGIADRARVLADAAGLPLPQDGLRPGDVFVAAAEGTGWACAVLEETIDYLAVALAAVQAVLDPERVILGGSTLAAAETLLPALARRLSGLARPPRLVPAELGAKAAILGAAAAARDGL